MAVSFFILDYRDNYNLLVYDPGCNRAGSNADLIGCSNPVYDLANEQGSPSGDSGVGDEPIYDTIA